ncbi:hypothetical protein BH23BAC3_BH23BAC3_17480 [soil metagenome]
MFSTKRAPEYDYLVHERIDILMEWELKDKAD